MSGEVKEEVFPIIQIQVQFNLQVEDLWDMFIDPFVLLQWLGNEITVDFEEGGMIRFHGENAPATAEIADHWTIRRIKPKRVILFSWDILGAETLFIARFRPTETGSVLDIKHGAIPIGAKNLHLPSHWNALLANLKSVLELGTPAIRFNYSNYHPLTPTRYDPTDLRISVVINTPPQLPFDVWTNPEKLSRFIRAKSPKIDKQYAGIYTWWREGKGPVVITKLVQDQELEFTWVYGMERETRVNIRFERAGDSTVVTLHHYGFSSPEETIGYDIGWTSMLCELKLICELGDSGITRIRDWEIERDDEFRRISMA